MRGRIVGFNWFISDQFPKITNITRMFRVFSFTDNLSTTTSFSLWCLIGEVYAKNVQILVFL